MKKLQSKVDRTMAVDLPWLVNRHKMWNEQLEHFVVWFMKSWTHTFTVTASQASFASAFSFCSITDFVIFLKLLQDCTSATCNRDCQNKSLHQSQMQQVWMLLVEHQSWTNVSPDWQCWHSILSSLFFELLPEIVNRFCYSLSKLFLDYKTTYPSQN